ncbi:unnamed protein product [uncultured bacterium]|nr:unnamed protein product [uncultured bacterium]
MNRNHRSRLERLERAAEGNTHARSGRVRAWDEDGLDALTLQELLALPECSLTMDDIQLAEAAVADASAARQPADAAYHETENDR